jgi:hypothetical protein
MFVGFPKNCLDWYFKLGGYFRSFKPPSPKYNPFVTKSRNQSSDHRQLVDLTCDDDNDMRVVADPLEPVDNDNVDQTKSTEDNQMSKSPNLATASAAILPSVPIDQRPSQPLIPGILDENADPAYQKFAMEVIDYSQDLQDVSKLVEKFPAMPANSDSEMLRPIPIEDILDQIVTSLQKSDVSHNRMINWLPSLDCLPLLDLPEVQHILTNHVDICDLIMFTEMKKEITDNYRTGNQRLMMIYKTFLCEFFNVHASFEQRKACLFNNLVDLHMKKLALA